MNQMIEIVKPTSFVRAGDHPLAERPEDLGGLRIGFFHNNKPNADVLLERIEELFLPTRRNAALHPLGKAEPYPARGSTGRIPRTSGRGRLRGGRLR